MVQATDGTEQVSYPSGDRRSTQADGTETYLFSNGDKRTTYRDGGQRTEWANGASRTWTPGRNPTVERRPD